MNTGTAPVFKVKPQFTLHFPKTEIGDAISLISSLVGETHKGLEVLPGSTYPEKSKPPLAFDKPTHFGDSMFLDQGNVSRLQKNDMLKLETNGIESKVVLIDTQGQDYESNIEWTNVISKIKANTAEIVFTTATGEVTKRNVAARGTTPVEKTVPEMTFKEALKLSHGAVEKNGKLYIGDNEVSKDITSLIVDQSTEREIKNQGVNSIFDVKLKSGMHFEMQSKMGIHVFSSWGIDGNEIYSVDFSNIPIPKVRYQLEVNGKLTDIRSDASYDYEGKRSISFHYFNYSNGIPKTSNIKVYAVDEKNNNLKVKIAEYKPN